MIEIYEVLGTQEAVEESERRLKRRFPITVSCRELKIQALSPDTEPWN